MFSSLTAAVDAASVDDTLLIHASANAYTFDNTNGFNKRLTVIGSGWNGLGTKIRGHNDTFCCGARVPFNAGAEGSIYRGIEFVSTAEIGASMLIFNYCRFKPETEYHATIRTNTTANCGTCGGIEYNAQDLLFENCYFNNHLENINNDTNLLFQNCIFQSLPTSSNYAAIRIGNNENSAPVNPIVFDHNIFLSPVHIDFSSAIFNNNIFAELSSAANSTGNSPNNFGNGNFCYNCQFNNNITYCTSCALNSIVGATFSNNLENQEMPFVNPNLNLTLADFNLIDSSAGNNFAIDGTDVGVHGGASAYIQESNYGSTILELPVVNTFTLFENILQQGDILQFNATSTIPVQE